MSIHEYVVSERDGLWEVRLDGRLVSGQPTSQTSAERSRGPGVCCSDARERSKILAGTLDGVAVEFPTIGLEAQPA